MPPLDAQLISKIKAKIDPGAIQVNLLIASSFLVGYELLHSTIVQGVKDFYCTLDTPREIKQYNEKMKSLHKDRMVASCLWLQNRGAITPEEVAVLAKIREHRNLIAHELPAVLIDHEMEIDSNLFSQMVLLQRKIDLWWFAEVEMSINPDLEGVEVSGVQTGRMLLMDYILQTLFGDAIKQYEADLKTLEPSSSGETSG